MIEKALQKKIACILAFALILTCICTGDFTYAAAKAYYSNIVMMQNTVEESFDLDFSTNKDDRETADGKLSWKKDTQTGGHILTLDSIYLGGSQNILLPTNEKVTILLKGENKIDGIIDTDGMYKMDIVITGEGILNTAVLPSGSVDGDTLTIQGGAKVYAKDRVSYGASGGANSILNVKGEGTLLDIDSTASPNNKGTYLQEINVADGAELNIRAREIGVYTITTSSLNVTNNSKLKVFSKYGVYVDDGKFTVDDTSILETNATSAGIVVVDTSGKKAQDEVLSLPDVPYGAEITSVEKNGTRFWTIAMIGSTVGIEDSTNDITGALGKMTIKKRADIGETGFTATLEKTQYEHTGGEIKPSATVKDSADKVLIQDKDYILSYQNNVDITTAASKAKAIVTGVGDYKGEIALTFDIVAKSGGGSSGGGGTSPGGGSSSGGGSSPGGGSPAPSDSTSKNNDDTKADEQDKNNNENKADREINIGKFDDTNKEAWYYDSVEFVIKNGYMTGISENKFAPNMPTSRAMINQIIYNLEKRPQTTVQHDFTDVAKDAWYEQALNFTFDKGIIVGFPDKTFRGNSTSTREQICLILYRYAMYKGYNSDTDVDMSKYEDFANTGNWAKTSIKWAVKHNVIKGRTNTKLDPASALTRAELAAVLKNFYSGLVK